MNVFEIAIDSADAAKISQIDELTRPAVYLQENCIAKINKISSHEMKLLNFKRDLNDPNEIINSMYYKGLPPYPPYICCSTTVCHLLKKRAELCCLKLNQVCAHSKATYITDYNFARKPIILAVDTSSSAIYNFIVPLRSASIPKKSMYPIIFVFEKE